MIRFNFKGTLQRLAQVRAFLGDINTPGGLGDATASDILAARAGGAVMLPVMTGLPLGKRCSRPAGVRLDGFRPSAFSVRHQPSLNRTGGLNKGEFLAHPRARNEYQRSLALASD